MEGVAGLTLKRRVPRRLVLHLPIPRDAPAGRYQGNIQLLSHQQLVQLPLEVEVLPLILPAASKPVGIYLDTPPYLGWFGQGPELASAQLAASRCDLARLAGLGISGVAPALPQDEAGMRTTQEEAIGLGFHMPLLAYASLKRWAATPTAGSMPGSSARRPFAPRGCPPWPGACLTSPISAPCPPFKPWPAR
ncbi:hypothetical protein ACSZOJ_12640 [Aeromonas dhakensis]